MRKLYLLAVLLMFVVIGCSSGNDLPSVPELGTKISDDAGNGSHMLWGLWQGAIDPVAQNVEFTELRTGEMHLNALPFLEPPPLVNLTLESLQFNGDIIEADIGLRHPFLGLTEFTGFDVCGIFISNGSVSGFSDPDIVMAGPGDTRLLNADGYARWWNPAEFPVNLKTMFSYNDGLLGTPDGAANYSSTVNGYKYFTDILEPDDALSNVPLESRGMFGAGQKNIRHYSIHLGAGLIFNYAVDASWEFPTGDKPWVPPDAFSPGANRPEAWRADITELVNSLYNDGTNNGGSLKLQIDVYDWYNAELNTVYADSPGNFTPVGPVSPIGGGEGYSTYEIEINGATPQNQDSIEVLITVKCEAEGYGGLLPGKTVAAYFVHSAEVGDNDCGGFSVTGADPPEAGSGSDYPVFEVYGINFQDGGNLAVDIVDNGDVVASAENVVWVDSSTLTCELSFCGVNPGTPDLRVTNGCEPVSYASMEYTVTDDPLKNIDLRPGVGIRDIGIRETTGEPYVLFDDGQLWIYTEDYSNGTYKVTNAALDYFDTLDNGDGCAGDSTDKGQYVYLLNSGYSIWGYTGNMMDVTETDPPGLGDRAYFWQNGGSYIMSTRRTPTGYGGNLTYFYIVGTGPGLVNLSAFKALHTSRDNSDDYYTMWCYALEGAPEFDIERYDYYATDGYHSISYDLTICGTQGDGEDELNDPRDISGDADDNIYILEVFSDGEPGVKVYDMDGNYLCQFGDSTSISGNPLRLDVDEGDGEVHVVHSNGVSVFRACEIPFS